MKKLWLSLAALLFSGAIASAQIVTASAYFNDVSTYYEGISTYEVDITVNAAGRRMVGHALFSRPQMVRIDFSTPRGQTLLFDGSTLIIYLPNQETVLQQAATTQEEQISARGLTLMRRYYTVAFESGPTPVPLDEGSSTKVVNLILTRRASSEAFSTIKLSIDANSKLIRRVEATTPQGKVYRFDFTNYSGINRAISDQRFIYDPPSSVNAYNNFLFQE
ncbi:MAG TPA: outer membrane lipoprotein carrier protein LolA [Treponema sp.]|jgi:outer membrane lipoprotein-sorting protein|nr:outer membrane lipoprotein carrier protein LolA [Treponema sp.]HAK69331.1 outer membrane lipoprotein carrier protein LolA [Treponema sp.]HBB43289.1 outer membrane lipoprotein carrier protein LolA [Treponema sp.]HCA20282.1 outer membrane lipoprotein carrier protein LolA [Treponema sp.]